ncbi:hypothetical protein HDU87_005737 [Geranomyces variabilis]|uniref:Uncharacterized protein n=1 Tax=Geranomyces variabilis TaxID=109894 RepID=A0AAD5XKU2_9FUNG|nr:hypothetical protein HDU87_005737 [Geranomyces variabilis]
MSQQREQSVNALQWCNLQLAYFGALSQFQCNALVSYAQSASTTAALETAIRNLFAHSRGAAFFAWPIVYQLITTIELVLAIDSGDEATAFNLSGEDRRCQLRRNAIQSLHKIFTLLEPQYLDELCINYRILNHLGGQVVHFHLADKAMRERESRPWVFYPGVLKLPDAATRDVPFTSFQHVVHGMADVLTILTTTDRVATFKGKVHKDYSGPPLWWLSVQPPAGGSSIPSLNRDDSRYGVVRFTFPIQAVLSQFPKRYLLGTRMYNCEYAHTIMLSTKDVYGLGAEIPTVDLARFRLLEWQEGSAQALWKCYRDTDRAWDHPEVACDIPADQTLAFDPSSGNVKIDFVTHNEYCVLARRPVNSTRNFPRETKCQCLSSDQAAGQFRNACNDKDPRLLDELYEAGFFEEAVWLQIMRQP